MPIYCGISGAKREIKKLYTGIGGIKKELKEMWAGYGGVKNKIFSSGTPIGSLQEGSIIQINENGSPVDFYVAKHDYESGLNGSGRTLVVRKSIYDNRQWHPEDFVYIDWTKSVLRSWLNSSYKSILDSDVQSLIGVTSYKYTRMVSGNPWEVITDVSNTSDAIFVLSATELGIKAGQFGHWYEEGSELPIASTLQAIGANGTQWTRTLSGIDGLNAIYTQKDGVGYASSLTASWGSRPAFTLPSDFSISI